MVVRSIDALAFAMSLSLMVLCAWFLATAGGELRRAEERLRAALL